MFVVHDELVIPQEFAGSRIEGEDRIGIEIRTRPGRAIEIRRRISDRHVQNTGFGVERERRPEAAAAMLQGARSFQLLAPGWPGLGTR